MHATEKLIASYYSAFNTGNIDAMLSCLHDNVVHDINQGQRENGKLAFRTFLERMNAHYKEELSDIVIMVDASGKHAASEFKVRGEYLKTDQGLPEARGQKYLINAGTFFDILDGKIARVTTHYNLNEWITLVK